MLDPETSPCLGFSRWFWVPYKHPAAQPHIVLLHTHLWVVSLITLLSTQTPVFVRSTLPAPGCSSPAGFILTWVRRPWRVKPASSRKQLTPPLRTNSSLRKRATISDESAASSSSLISAAFGRRYGRDHQINKLLSGAAQRFSLGASQHDLLPSENSLQTASDASGSDGAPVLLQHTLESISSVLIVMD
ncbi:hypothetical protein CRENBAI_004387 [Crenichthys baileyi]|uniref:Pecanex-like protein n=1 Tax=Crenichthys baileyi TaxID=28760 RepID=A0AAV9S2F0_9TELE